MEVQYITNAGGQHTAVIIPIDEWYGLTAKYPEVAGDASELPQWQKDLIDERLAYMQAHPESNRPISEFYAALDKIIEEDEGASTI